MLCNYLQNVAAITYIFVLQLSTFLFYNKQKCTTITTKSKKYTLKKLSKKKTYYVKVRAIAQGGGKKVTGKYGKAVKFTTYVVPKVKKISVKNNKKGMITITASKVKGAAGYAFVVTADSGLTDIVAIKATYKHTVGLKADGTVVAVGFNKYGQCDVSDWTDIIAIDAATFHTVGLKADGTVVAIGNNGDGQCNVSDWKDIVAVNAGGWDTVGLKADGTVVVVGGNVDDKCNASGWTDIKLPN